MVRAPSMRSGVDAIPPGPRMPTPLQAVAWAVRPLPFMTRCRERYGEIFTLHIRRGSPWVLVSDPQDVKAVFTADAALVRPAAVEANPVLGPLLGSRSVMLLDEPDHMAQRKRMLPPFHARRMHSYGEMITEVTRRAVARWPVGEPFPLWPRMQAISSEVVIRAVFGTADTIELEHMSLRLNELNAWLSDSRRLTALMILGPGWLSRSAGFRSRMQAVEAAVLGEVNRRRAVGDSRYGDDILSMLEQAHERSERPMGGQELRDELITLLSDGPTSTSLAWAFERLLQHPEKLARVREETLAGRGDTYADAVVKETLRLCPVVPLVPRRLLAPMQLGRFEVPASTVVAPCVYLVHRRADIYPRPLSFVPERFLEQSTPGYAWIPFGGGARRCLAANFAHLAIKRIMQTVICELDLRRTKLGSESATRGSVAFAPGDQALVIARPRRGCPAGHRRDPAADSDPSANGIRPPQ